MISAKHVERGARQRPEVIIVAASTCRHRMPRVRHVCVVRSDPRPPRASQQRRYLAAGPRYVLGKRMRSGSCVRRHIADMSTAADDAESCPGEVSCALCLVDWVAARRFSQNLRQGGEQAASSAAMRIPTDGMSQLRDYLRSGQRAACVDTFRTAGRWTGSGLREAVQRPAMSAVTVVMPELTAPPRNSSNRLCSVSVGEIVDTDPMGSRWLPGRERHGRKTKLPRAPEPPTGQSGAIRNVVLVGHRVAARRARRGAAGRLRYSQAGLVVDGTRL